MPAWRPAAVRDVSTAQDEGFTLVELLVSLVLFALISVAGLALVDSVLGVQGRTETRLDRLGELQRATLLVTSDIEQVASGDIAGRGDRLTFTRAAPGVGGPPVGVGYAASGGALMRSVGGRPQVVLAGVSGVRWRFFGDAGWVDQWPVGTNKALWPRAIALELAVAPGRGLGGPLRRVVVLPARAAEPPPS